MFGIFCLGVVGLTTLGVTSSVKSTVRGSRNHHRDDFSYNWDPNQVPLGDRIDRREDEDTHDK